ncbi:MAG: alpha-galactosidase [Clostridia bacterium]|nr:alpha-galactosidase [Clostridia bacterium]
MIRIEGNYFRLDTENTTYLFKVVPTGHLVHVYYGKKLIEKDYAFIEEHDNFGCCVHADEGDYFHFTDWASFECSTFGRGDAREAFVIVNVDGDRVNDFTYDSAKIVNDHKIPALPQSHGKTETLCVTLRDKAKGLKLDLYYSVTEGVDVIVKSSSITNESGRQVCVERLMSAQLDIPEDDFLVDTLIGAWGKERNIHTEPLMNGVTKIDSKYGFSSCMRNPYVVLKKSDCGYHSGECYGFNLVYSGEHAEYLDKNVARKVRVLNGINDASFAWKLGAGETFYTPESTVCYSANGTNGLTQNYHNFINGHIVRGHWQYRERPILCNNWEVTGVNFTEETLISIAKRAKTLGVELFVLDDGWYGYRNDEQSGLGDWWPNTDKLPDGLEGLCKKINDIGLDFGIWVEPEMVSTNSDLFRAHPDWVIQNPDYNPLVHRAQYILDLCNPDVCAHIIEAISTVISSGVAYVKWDCNRYMSEYYSLYLPKDRQCEVMHRYMLGFYSILQELTRRFPKVLFEGCSQGGNRFDMGVMCYFPQTWCSDNTDAFDRVKIQEGTLSCYPQSTFGAHISKSPNKQTFRSSMVESRFNTACIGAFGYELDLSKISELDTKAVIEQIRWYKKYRKTLQFGTYYRLESVFADPHASWAVVSKDQKQAVVNVTNQVFELYCPQTVVHVPGLKEGGRYEFKTRKQYFPQYEGQVWHEECVSPAIENDEDVLARAEACPAKVCEMQRYELYGKTLWDTGVRLNPELHECADRSALRIMYDFGSRLYSIDEIE